MAIVVIRAVLLQLMARRRSSGVSDAQEEGEEESPRLFKGSRRACAAKIFPPILRPESPRRLSPRSSSCELATLRPLGRRGSRVSSTGGVPVDQGSFSKEKGEGGKDFDRRSAKNVEEGTREGARIGEDAVVVEHQDVAGHGEEGAVLADGAAAKSVPLRGEERRASDEGASPLASHLCTSVL